MTMLPVQGTAAVMERNHFNRLFLASLFRCTRIDGYVELEKYAPQVFDSMVSLLEKEKAAMTGCFFPCSFHLPTLSL